MTGEITLRGRVLAIGGLREKTMAAYLAGVKSVIIPEENMKDLDELDPGAKEALTFIPCRSADQVLEHALVKQINSNMNNSAVTKANNNGIELYPDVPAFDRPGAHR
jgi:ATP-dependent Lon protease